MRKQVGCCESPQGIYKVAGGNAPGTQAPVADPEGVTSLAKKERHKKQTFEEELIMLLKRYRVPYDERYIWW